MALRYSPPAVFRAEAGNGNKKVDIKMPFAEIHVGTDTDAKDTGLASYPGRQAKQITTTTSIAPTFPSAATTSASVSVTEASSPTIRQRK